MSQSPAVENYFRRFGWCVQQLAAPAHADLGLVVVIPCYDEPNLLAALRALWHCTGPRRAVEIIVVVNSSELDPPEVLARNRATVEEVRAHAQAAPFPTYLIDAPNLPAKQAGVGLARKIGMDEAVRRFDTVSRLDGVIACFDADCACDPNYLVATETYFNEHAAAPGASIYFEHPLDAENAEAIAQYELHLRYYVEALRHAEFPHAYHTIGSSMAVRADAYFKQGGMNKRKAGEDFYFLHKIIPLGGFGEINETRVIPSPRASHRVPFGTGRAVGEFLREGRYSTYPPQAFEDLRVLFTQAARLFQGTAVDLPPALFEYLAQVNFEKAIEEIRANTTSPETFRRRFFRWFDGFQAMKFIHYARDRHYGEEPVERAAEQCLVKLGHSSQNATTLDLLGHYRNRQRGR